MRSYTVTPSSEFCSPDLEFSWRARARARACWEFRILFSGPGILLESSRSRSCVLGVSGEKLRQPKRLHVKTLGLNGVAVELPEADKG